MNIKFCQRANSSAQRKVLDQFIVKALHKYICILIFLERSTNWHIDELGEYLSVYTNTTFPSAETCIYPETYYIIFGNNDIHYLGIPNAVSLENQTSLAVLCKGGLIHC